MASEGLPASLTQPPHETPPATAGFRVVDVTADVEEAVRESGVTEGLACVYSPETSCVVRVNELESGLLEDFARLLEHLARDAPPDRRGALLAMLVGPAGELVPVVDGHLALGQWQRVLLIALGDGPAPRWLVRVVGVSP